MPLRPITDAFVSTPEITGMGDIDLQESGKYRIAAIGPRPTTWELAEAESPYVHGTTLTGARKQRSIMPITFVVQGTSFAQLMADVSVLCRAFEQFRYRFGFKWDDVPFEYYGAPANHDGGIRGDLMRVLRFLITFQIPTEPIPIEGPF